MKKPRGKTAQSQEPTPAIARLAFDPERDKGEFRLFGGAQHDEWNQHLIVQLAGSDDNTEEQSSGGP